MERGHLSRHSLGAQAPADGRRRAHHHRLHFDLRLGRRRQHRRLRRHRSQPVDAHGHQLLPVLVGRLRLDCPFVR